MRYRVELDELVAFVDRLRTFERKAEATAERVDRQIAALHDTWTGTAAAAHRSQHDDWMAATAQMREAVTHLRDAAENAHSNYTDAARLNVDMLS